MNSYVFYAETNSTGDPPNAMPYEMEVAAEIRDAYPPNEWPEWMNNDGVDYATYGMESPPTFPDDDRRPNVGPPKMMRCG
jgi:hypothetical protein